MSSESEKKSEKYIDKKLVPKEKLEFLNFMSESTVNMGWKTRAWIAVMIRNTTDLIPDEFFKMRRRALSNQEQISKSDIQKIKYGMLALDVSLGAISKIISMDFMGCTVKGNLDVTIIRDVSGKNPDLKITIEEIEKKKEVVNSQPREGGKHGQS